MHAGLNPLNLRPSLALSSQNWTFVVARTPLNTAMSTVIQVQPALNEGRKMNTWWYPVSLFWVIDFMWNSKQWGCLLSELMKALTTLSKGMFVQKGPDLNWTFAGDHNLLTWVVKNCPTQFTFAGSNWRFCFNHMVENCVFPFIFVYSVLLLIMLKKSKCCIFLGTWGMFSPPISLGILHLPIWMMCKMELGSISCAV